VAGAVELAIPLTIIARLQLLLAVHAFKTIVVKDFLTIAMQFHWIDCIAAHGAFSRHWSVD
jgi:hypothetical protein